MKKVISLVLVALLVMGGVAFATSYTVARPNWRSGHGQGDVMGQGKYLADPHRAFRLVRWKHADHTTVGVNYTASADMLVIWDSGVSGDDGITVTTTTTTGDSRVAGVLVHNVTRISTDGDVYATQDVGDVNWAWIQTYGLGTVFVAETVSAGEAFGTSSYPGLTSEFSAAPTSGTPGNPTKQGFAGFYYDNGTAVQGGGKVPTNVPVQCFIKCE